jgi:TPR repeat protein
LARNACGINIAGEVEFSILLFNGEGVPKDEARAARYFRHAAGRGLAVSFSTPRPWR